MTALGHLNIKRPLQRCLRRSTLTRISLDGVEVASGLEETQDMQDTASDSQSSAVAEPPCYPGGLLEISEAHTLHVAVINSVSCL